MSVSPDTVYRALRSAIVDRLALEPASASRVAIVVEPNLDASDEWFIQISGIGGLQDFPRSGLTLQSDRVAVTVWLRQLKDPGGKASNVIAATDGLLAKSRAALESLQGSTLGGILTVPLRLLTNGKPREAPRAKGFTAIEWQFGMSYEMGYASSYHFGWSATQPADGTGFTEASLGQRIPFSRVPTTDAYLWALVPSTAGDVTFLGEAGLTPFYSDQDEPPSGPACGTVTIGGITYRRWRAPYQTSATEATYLVQR